MFEVNQKPGRNAASGNGSLDFSQQEDLGQALYGTTDARRAANLAEKDSEPENAEMAVTKKKDAAEPAEEGAIKDKIEVKDSKEAAKRISVDADALAPESKPNAESVEKDGKTDKTILVEKSAKAVSAAGTKQTVNSVLLEKKKSIESVKHSVLAGDKAPRKSREDVAKPVASSKALHSSEAPKSQLIANSPAAPKVAMTEAVYPDGQIAETAKNKKVKAKAGSVAMAASRAENTASAVKKPTGQEKIKDLKVADKELLMDENGRIGSSDAADANMQLKSAFKTTENGKAQPVAFERRGLTWSGKEAAAKESKKGSAAARFAAAAPGSGVSAKAAIGEKVGMEAAEAFVNRSQLASMNSAKSFEVQITRDVQSTSAADAVKAVRQAFDQISEAQPSKMRFSLNMANGERIEIQVVQREGGLQVRLAAHSAELRDALTRSWDSLTQNARAKGIRLFAPVIEAPANTFNLDRGNQAQQQQSGFERQNQNSDPRQDRQQDTPNQARDREKFREAFRENLSEHARLQQNAFGNDAQPTNSTFKK